MKKAKGTRASIPASVEIAVLVKCRRICAFCYGLEQNRGWQQDGQIAHINRDPSDAAPDNLAYLCLAHHVRYDNRSPQVKSLQPDELRHYVKMVHDYVAGGNWTWTDAGKPERMPKQKSHRAEISAEVYKLRLPIYYKTVEFLRDVVKDLQPHIQRILLFANETEEALFLYDERIADYLTLLFQNALQLHTLNLILEQPSPNDNYAELSKERLDLSVWLTNQYAEIRARFTPFLRVA